MKGRGSASPALLEGLIGFCRNSNFGPGRSMAVRILCLFGQNYAELFIFTANFLWRKRSQAHRPAQGFSNAAEWSRHEATWLGCRHHPTDWPDKLDTFRCMEISEDFAANRTEYVPITPADGVRSLSANRLDGAASPPGRPHAASHSAGIGKPWAPGVACDFLFLHKFAVKIESSA